MQGSPWQPEQRKKVAATVTRLHKASVLTLLQLLRSVVQDGTPSKEDWFGTAEARRAATACFGMR